MFIQFFLENYENNEIVYIILTSCTPIKELCSEYLPVFVRKIFLLFLKYWWVLWSIFCLDLSGGQLEIHPGLWFTGVSI